MSRPMLAFFALALVIAAPQVQAEDRINSYSNSSPAPKIERPAPASSVAVSNAPKPTYQGRISDPPEPSSGGVAGQFGFKSSAEVDAASEASVLDGKRLDARTYDDPRGSRIQDLGP